MRKPGAPDERLRRPEIAGGIRRRGDLGLGQIEAHLRIVRHDLPEGLAALPRFGSAAADEVAGGGPPSLGDRRWARLSAITTPPSDAR